VAIVAMGAIGAVMGAIGAAIVASPAFAVTITGRVVKGAEHAPVAGVPVSVHIVRGNEELPGRTMPTDASGTFRFDGMTAGSGLDYYVSTEYEQAFYTEGPIAVSGGAGKQDLIVYDVAKDFAKVHVQDHHVIVERKEDGLHVTEIVIFQNDASTAYLGVGVNHASPSGMRVGLPASVKDFKPGLGLDEQSVNLQGRELTSLRPIPPGQRPLSFTYTVPLSGRMDLSHRLYFPTVQMTLLLDDPKLKVESKQLRSGGAREQGGKTYATYFGSNLPVGSEVSARIGGAGFFSNPKIYPFMAAPVAIAVVLWVAARRGRKKLEAKHAQPAFAGAGGGGASAAHGGGGASAAHGGLPSLAPGGVPSPAAAAPPMAPAAPSPGARASRGASRNGDEMAQVYFYLIAALDQGVERGDISAESHELVRANLKRRLEAIIDGAPPAQVR
jgi:hypothetical protein